MNYIRVRFQVVRNKPHSSVPSEYRPWVKVMRTQNSIIDTGWSN